MERPAGVVAAVLTWLGWLTVSPSLGFPTVGTAAMVNRAIDKRADPGFWVGWVIVVAALVALAAVFFAAERARLVRASIGTGVIYGALLWLVAGLVVMPILGIPESPSPIPANLPVAPPADPMLATVMMHSLGALAPLSALIAWLLFGAIVGATASPSTRLVAAAATAPS